MGTTVTTNLGLIKPDTDESIREDLPASIGWAAQNELNCNKLDSLFRAQAFTTYPLGFDGSTGGFVLGAGGFSEGKYLRLWPRLVIAYFRVFCGGAGFAAGTGFYKFNLPTGIDPDLTTFGTEALAIGKCIFQDASAVLNSSTFLINYHPSVSGCIMRPSAGGLVGNTVPVVPAQNDRFSGYMMYATSDA